MRQQGVNINGVFPQLTNVWTSGLQKSSHEPCQTTADIDFQHIQAL